MGFLAALTIKLRSQTNAEGTNDLFTVVNQPNCIYLEDQMETKYNEIKTKCCGKPTQKQENKLEDLMKDMTMRRVTRT